MLLPGHRQLHRETNVIRECRKQTFLVSDTSRATDAARLHELREKLRDDLQRSPLTVPPVVASVSKDSFLAETDMLIKERVNRIDAETKAMREQNFKELAKRLQGSFNLGGTKTMQRVTGKMSRNHGMWGVHTDYPNTIRVCSPDANSVGLQKLENEGRLIRSTLDAYTDFTATKLRHVYD
eukprot:3732451-Rhodomonas_salina.1